MANTGALWGSGTPVTAQSNGSWSGATNANGANNATFATWTSTGSGATGSIRVIGHGAQTAIGSAPQSVDSIAVTVYGYVTNTTRMASIAVQLFDGATAIGTAQTMTKSTTTTFSQTFTFTGVTWAQLANLGVRVLFTRGAVTTAANGLVDAISIDVTYTPVPPSTMTLPWRSGGAWLSKPLWRRSGSNTWLPMTSLTRLAGGGGGVTPVTFVAAATTGVDDSLVQSFTFNKPASVVAGDLAIGVFVEWNDAAFPTLTLPSGATLISQRTNTAGLNGSGNIRTTIWGKTVGTETSYTLQTSASCWASHHAVFLRGWDSTMFFSDMWIDGLASIGNDATVDATGDNYPAGAMAVWIVGNDNDGSGLTHTPPTGFTERVESQGCTIATMENPNTTLSATGGTISTATTYAVELLKILPA